MKNEETLKVAKALQAVFPKQPLQDIAAQVDKSKAFGS